MHEIEWRPSCGYSKDAVNDRKEPCEMLHSVHTTLFWLDLVFCLLLVGCVMLICGASLRHRWAGHTEKGRLPKVR